jgi:hypothetical protein
VKFIKENILFIAVILGVLWLYFFVEPTNRKADFMDMSNYTKVKEYRDTIYQDTIIYKWIKGDSISYKVIDTLEIPVTDTFYILNDYNSIRAYSDTIRIDSSTFVVDDTISQNKILSRGFTANISTRTIKTKEYFVQKARYGLYLGIRASFRQDNGLEVLSPGLMLNAKNKALIGLNVDINKNYNIGYSGSLYLKLGKK